MCNGNGKFGGHALEKSSLNIYKQIHILMYMCQAFSPKTQATILTWPYILIFLEWRLTRFGKELFMYAYINEYMHSYIYICVCVHVRMCINTIYTYMNIYIYLYIHVYGYIYMGT